MTRLGQANQNLFRLKYAILAADLEAHATVTTLTSQEFSQDTRAARTAASQGPVFITDEGRVAHVLLSIDDYDRLISGGASVADALAQPGTDFDFDPPRLRSLGLRSISESP